MVVDKQRFFIALDHFILLCRYSRRIFYGQVAVGTCALSYLSGSAESHFGLKSRHQDPPARKHGSLSIKEFQHGLVSDPLMLLVLGCSAGDQFPVFKTRGSFLQARRFNSKAGFSFKRASWMKLAKARIEARFRDMVAGACPFFLSSSGIPQSWTCLSVPADKACLYVKRKEL